MVNARILAASAAALMVGPPAVSAQSLGEIHFPTSGAPAAQPHFEAGVLFLHNFEYEQAAARFKEARRIDPSFALAYWGEAQTHNHPIWMQQDRKAALDVLSEYGASPEERLAKAPTERERDWLRTVEVLYGDGPKEDRDDRYSDAMRRLAEKYPDDHEAVTFYALSILGTAHEGRDFATYMRAAAVAEPVFLENRRHPGAAHYVIHAFDDPIHAPLGLPAARAYSDVAPDAGHAQHMTSHIFVALGLWEDVVNANVRARDVQDAGLAQAGRPANVCGHYTSWLHYGYLQRGQLEEAGRTMHACLARMREAPTRPEASYFVAMRGRAVIDAEAWDGIDGLAADLSAFPGLSIDYDFVDAYAALRQGRPARARALRERQRGADAEPEGRSAILLMEVDGLLAIADGDPERGIELLSAAASREEGLPYEFGPPATLMPPHELLARELAALGRHEEARAAWESQLARTPKRTSALLGLARTATALGDDTVAAEAYGTLAGVWANADRGVPGLQEARRATPP